MDVYLSRADAVRGGGGRGYILVNLPGFVCIRGRKKYEDNVYKKETLCKKDDVYKKETVKGII